MSSDLLIEHVWIARGVEPDWKAAEAVIRALTDEEVEKLEEFEYREETPELIPEQLLADLSEIRDVWGVDRKDAYLCTLGPIDVLLTGGMSYGDSPTEMFDTIGRVCQCLPAVAAAGWFAWPPEATRRDKAAALLSDTDIDGILTGAPA